MAIAITTLVVELCETNARHKTVTESASIVYQALLAAGFIPHPGVIEPSPGGGQIRIAVDYEPTRVQVKVSGKGVQWLSLYGPIDRALLLTTLNTCTHHPIRVRELTT